MWFIREYGCISSYKSSGKKKSVFVFVLVRVCGGEGGGGIHLCVVVIVVVEDVVVMVDLFLSLDTGEFTLILVAYTQQGIAAH